MTMLIAKIVSFVKGKYNAMRYGDVFQNWDRLMRLVRLTDSDEADPTTRKKKATINGLIALYKFLTLFRISLSVLLVTGVDHVIGQTLNQTGSLSKLIVAVTGVVLAQWTLYRLVCIRMTLKGDMIFMQTLKSMVDGQALEEPHTSADVRTPDSETIREQKVGLARLVYAAAVLCSIPMTICPFFAVSVYLNFNIQASQTTFQTCCWVFWYVQDLIMSTAVASDFLLYPSMWFVVALNYRIDLLSLTAKIQQLMGMTGMVEVAVEEKQPVLQLIEVRDANVRLAEQALREMKEKAVLLFKEIRGDYLRLAEQAARVNRMSSPILFVLVLCTTPLVCICVFVTTYSDNLIFKVMFMVFGCVCTMFACLLLAIASDITSKSEGLHEVLCAAAARQSVASLLSVQQRGVLLLMLEHAASESHSFAMMTMDGQKYTMESFVAFLIETGLQYTLLFSFNHEIAFK